MHLKTKEWLGDEPVKNWRPTLVSAGIALAPDTFQMVLDAESTAKGIIFYFLFSFDVLPLERLWVVVVTAVNKHIKTVTWGTTYIAVGISISSLHSPYVPELCGKLIPLIDLSHLVPVAKSGNTQ